MFENSLLQFEPSQVVQQIAPPLLRLQTWEQVIFLRQVLAHEMRKSVIIKYFNNITHSKCDNLV